MPQMAQMPMTLMLEREVAARPPLHYAGRFPAEFRARPLGWTERSRAAAPAQLAEPEARGSSVGVALPADLPLDAGPPSLVKAARAESLIESSNRPVEASAPVLAFAASRIVAIRDAGPQAHTHLLDPGPLCLLAPPLAPHEAASNQGATRWFELDIKPARRAASLAPPPSALSIGDPSSWSRASPETSAALLQSSRLNEASYAA